MYRKSWASPSMSLRLFMRYLLVLYRSNPVAESILGSPYAVAANMGINFSGEIGEIRGWWVGAYTPANLTMITYAILDNTSPVASPYSQVLAICISWLWLLCDSVRISTLVNGSVNSDTFLEGSILWNNSYHFLPKIINSVYEIWLLIYNLGNRLFIRRIKQH